MISLFELLDKSGVNYLSSDTVSKKDAFITGLSSDSRAVKPGELFFAIPGSKDNGQKYIADAIGRGAVAIATTLDESVKLPEYDVPVLFIKDIEKAVGKIASVFFLNPSDDLLSIAVTGTNGKTSIAWLLSHMLSYLGCPASMLGTLGAAIEIPIQSGKSNPESNLGIVDTNNTTPGPIDIQRFLADARESRRRAVVMEVTSHALAQGRARGVSWDAAVFTNLTRDHLDYHGTLDEYGLAKAELFKTELRESSKPNKIAVFNIDDEFGNRLYNELNRDLKSFKCVSVGVENHSADVTLVKKQCSLLGSEMLLCINGEEIVFSMQLVGSYNIYNAILSIATLLNLGFKVENIKNALSKVPPVSGRLERLQLPNRDFEVFVDYAHTPDALVNVLLSLREVTQGKLIAVFGCGGDRDRGKRPLMGEAVSKYADCALVTSDNPRSEDPEAIINDIIPGLGESNGEFCGKFYWERIADRREAIKRALSLSRPGDAIVIAGKGHEDYQEINGVKYPFSDQEVTKLFLLV